MKFAVLAFLVSAAVTMLLAPVIIPMLRRLKFGQNERSDGPQSHLTKAGTPTMGGMMFIAGIIVGTIAFSLNATELVLPALLGMAAFAVIGFLDDFLKVKRKNTVGLRPYQKIIAQFVVAFVLALYAYSSPFVGSKIYLAFFKTEWDLGIFYIPVMMFIIIGTVNSVNLTDGLDGLCSSVSLVYSLSMTAMFLLMASTALTVSNAVQSQYAAELDSMAIFAASVAGGCMGFLKNNTYPARVFMGDTGSMALGGAIAVMAMFSRSVLLLAIMGGCFVASSVSCILQVGSYKLRKKRIFKMAPLHHHFELLGCTETHIVSAYTIVTVFLCLVCLLAYL